MAHLTMVVSMEISVANFAFWNEYKPFEGPANKLKFGLAIKVKDLEVLRRIQNSKWNINFHLKCPS